MVMKTSYKIAEFSRIPIELHISFLLLFLFIVVVGGYSYTQGQPEALGAIVSIVMIFSLVVLHELTHSLVGRHFGLKISKIVLLPIGGVANMEEYPKEARKEFLISVSGPALNLGLAMITFLILLLIGFADRITPFFDLTIRTPGDILVIFFKANLVLGLFNLFIPALPMDGGRVFRSLLSFKMGYSRATSVSTELAKIIAIFMALAGLMINPWLIIIAFFVYIGASQEGEFSHLSNLLAGVSVRDLMTTEVITVPSDMGLEEFSDLVFNYRYMGYPVKEDDRVVGVVSFSDLSKVPRERIGEYRVSDVMSRGTITIEEGEEAFSALMEMSQKGVKRLLVVKGGEVVGLISRTDLVRAIELQRMLE